MAANWHDIEFTVNDPYRKTEPGSLVYLKGVWYTVRRITAVTLLEDPHAVKVYAKATVQQGGHGHVD